MKPTLASIIATTLATETATASTNISPEIDDVWYGKLKKSALTPPSWVFGYAWAILYSFIIVSFVIYVNAKYTATGILLYVVQFAMNLLWSGIFFGQRELCRAFVHLALLNILVFFTYIEFLKASKTAASLLLPYMAWIFLALYLNYYICANN
jgi:tryptophan-rich sensory protein